MKRQHPPWSATLQQMGHKTVILIKSDTEARSLLRAASRTGIKIKLKRAEDWAGRWWAVRI